MNILDFTFLKSLISSSRIFRIRFLGNIYEVKDKKDANSELTLHICQ